jgi:hypothetical protein
VNNLDIQSGALVKVFGQTMKISGVLSGSGFLQADSGTIELNGVAAQTIAGSNLLKKIVGTLIISNNQGVSLSGINDTLKIRNLLRFGASNCNLTTNGNLMIMSDSLGTASVGDMTSDGTNTGVFNDNRITGNVTVERYIPNHIKAWQFLGIPTAGQTIKQSWMENNSPLGNTRPGYGGLITSNLGGNNAGAQALGFDLYSPNGPGMKYYNPAANNWTGVSSANDLISNTQGYMVFIRGDRSVTAFNQPATATTLRTTGQLKTPLNNPPAVINVPASSFVSVGNPYASAIDFSRVTRTGGVQDLFYVWDPLLSPGFGFGAYQTFIRSGASYLVVPGGGSYASGNTRIESGAAFFVRANSTGSGTVTISESSKVNGSNLVTRQPVDEKPRWFTRLYSGVNGALLDGVLTEIDSTYSNTVDAMDAWKIGSTTGEQIALVRDSVLLTVDRMQQPTVADTIHYRLGQLRRQSYSLQWIPEGISDMNLQPLLIDKYLSTEQPLSLSDTSYYAFTVNTDAASARADRFDIVFRPLTPVPVLITDIRAVRVDKSKVTVFWEVNPEEEVAEYVIEASLDGRLFEAVGLKTPLRNDGSMARYVFTDERAPSSVCFYRVKVHSFNRDVLYTRTVSVNAVESSMSFAVNPNPIENGQIRVAMYNIQAGRYRFRLVDQAGKEVMQFEKSLMSGDQIIEWQTKQISAGSYILQIISPDGHVYNTSLVMP